MSVRWFWGQQAALVMLSSLLYVGFFHFDAWLMAPWAHNPDVSWIFLPAGFRVLLVLGLGLPGALGIMLGNWWIDLALWTPELWLSTLFTGVVSGFAPWLVRQGMERWGRLDAGLQRLDAAGLLQFVLLYAALNALGHQLLWSALPRLNTVPWVDVWPMFVGDLMGALILLFLMQQLLRLWRGRRAAP